MSEQQHTADSVDIRMYRPGTGDFFILTFKSKNEIIFRLMIDCGGIQGSKAIFVPLVKDLIAYTGGVIDLLVVTHEHADHINGFKFASDEFDKIKFGKVWLAWTEDPEDTKAREYRHKIMAMKVALGMATDRLVKLKNTGHYRSIFGNQYMGEDVIQAKESFIDGVEKLEALNYWGINEEEKRQDTMMDMLKKCKVVKTDTVVEYLSPNELRENISGLSGVRFFILGPPLEYSYLKLEEKHGETYEKRPTPSTTEAAFIKVLTDPELGIPEYGPFDNKYESRHANEISEVYGNLADIWRKIDDDWLYSAGSLGLKLQGCINNTSLAIAIQFISSEKVLLFPGDAEYGSWKSWEDNLKWNLSIGGSHRTVDIKYLLSQTVFYKVSHHISQNGTPSKRGIEQMTHQELQAMATLDFERIMPGWKNTMPNDFIAAGLIDRTKGKLYFTGNRSIIMKNIKTDRVTVCTPHSDELEAVNKVFDGKPYLEVTVKA